MTLKINRASLLSNITFHHHMWIQTGVMVWKRLNWVLTSVNLIRWWKQNEKGVMDRRIDRQTETSVLRAAWSQLKTRTTRTPAFWWYPLLPHDYPYYWVILDPKSKEDKVKNTNFKNSPKFSFFQFWNKYYTGHTFLSCLIRCANMKWIRQVLLKIQSRHDSVHRWTDGQMDKLKPVSPPFQLRWSRGYNNPHSSPM